MTGLWNQVYPGTFQTPYHPSAREVSAARGVTSSAVDIQKSAPVQRLNSIEGEICAHSSVVTRFSALFGVQVLLAVLYLTLLVVTAVAMQTSDTGWYTGVAIGWTIGYGAVICLHVFSYITWIRACHVLSSKGEPHLVIGVPMHTSMQKSCLAITGVTFGITVVMTNLFFATSNTSKPIQHSKNAGPLYLLMFLCQVGLASMISSLSSQVYPRINVSNVTCYLTKHAHPE
jgi:hypothetical protein